MAQETTNNLLVPSLQCVRSAGTMLKVVGVLIKLSARDQPHGLMNWYHGRVETTPPDASSEIITLPYSYVLKNRDFRRNLVLEMAVLGPSVWQYTTSCGYD